MMCEPILKIFRALKDWGFPYIHITRFSYEGEVSFGAGVSGAGYGLEISPRGKWKRARRLNYKLFFRGNIEEARPALYDSVLIKAGIAEDAEGVLNVLKRARSSGDLPLVPERPLNRRRVIHV
jgi:hypothetical protein